MMGKKELIRNTMALCVVLLFIFSSVGSIGLEIKDVIESAFRKIERKAFGGKILDSKFSRGK